MEQTTVTAKYARIPDDSQVNWGSCDDPRGNLNPNDTYKVDEIEVHGYHTKVHINGRAYNSVSFDFTPSDAIDTACDVWRSINHA